MPNQCCFPSIFVQANLFPIPWLIIHSHCHFHFPFGSPAICQVNYCSNYCSTNFAHFRCGFWSTFYFYPSPVSSPVASPIPIRIFPFPAKPRRHAKTFSPSAGVFPSIFREGHRGGRIHNPSIHLLPADEVRNYLPRRFVQKIAFSAAPPAHRSHLAQFEPTKAII